MTKGSGRTSTRATAHNAAQSVELNGALQLLARVGFAVLGLLHVIIGAIAISIATVTDGPDSDQSGALNQIANTPGGTVVLWTVVVGMTALGIWQLALTVLVPSRDAKRKWATRLKELSKGASYFFIGGLAFVFAFGGTPSTKESTQGFSASLLEAPGGAVLLAVIGAVVAGVGVAFVFRGASRRFTEDITVPPGTVGRVAVLLGAVGFIAKGVALGVVGVLFVVGAFTYDSSKASGLDGAISSLASLPYGKAMIIVVGSGLIAYGLYCLARARLARL